MMQVYRTMPATQQARVPVTQQACVPGTQQACMPVTQQVHMPGQQSRREDLTLTSSLLDWWFNLILFQSWKSRVFVFLNRLRHRHRLWFTTYLSKVHFATQISR